MLDIVYGDSKLYLVFEYVPKDLKKHLDSIGGPMAASAVKYSLF